MKSMRRMSSKPVGGSGAHAPARLRRAATSTCSRGYGHIAPVGQHTWLAIIGVDGRPKGLERHGTG